MHIGLIGGICPAATDFYYRRLISIFASKKAALELTIVHADTPTLLSNLVNNDVAGQVAIYMRLSDRLVAAGAECVVVTSIAGHFCIDVFKAVSPLPVVDMISEVGRVIERRSLKPIGILGTRTVMETRFYGGVASAEIIPPSGQDLDDVHQAYVAMATSGVVTEAQAQRERRGDHAWRNRSCIGLQSTTHRVSARRLRWHPCRRDREVGNPLRAASLRCRPWMRGVVSRAVNCTPCCMHRPRIGA
jgi:aspartate racemase